MKISEGKHLFTKDGRKVGNGIVVAEQTHDFANLGKVWLIETDFGNTMRFTEQEIAEFYHDDTAAYTDVNTWRWDRLKRALEQDKLKTMLDAIIEEIGRPD